MKSSYIVILAGLLCIMLAAAGCTGTSPVTAPTTPAATPAAVPPETPASPVEAGTPAAVAAPGTMAATPVLSFTGTWNTTWNSTENKQYGTVMVLDQAGTTVKGSYDNADSGSGKGSVTGTAFDNHLTGWWNESDAKGEYGGPLELTLSGDGKTFTGRWASESEGVGAINTSVQFWSGVKE